MTAKRVLLVEEVPVVRRSIREALEQAGHAVWEADNGRVALGLLEGMVFDALIADPWRAAGDDLDVLDQLRRLTPAVPVIALAGDRPDGARGAATATRALADGAAAVVAMPLDADDLVRTIAEVTAA